MSEVRILLPTDKEAVMAYAKARLALRVSEPMEREMRSWDARWRGEALDHYLPQGWSFAAFAADQMQGFILAQPFLFYRGLTQTLWVECVIADAHQVERELLEVAHRWARDKHLQCLIVENSEDIAHIVRDWPAAKPLDESYIEIRSARFT